MKYQRQTWFGAWTLFGCALMAGCHAPAQQRAPAEVTPKLTGAQTADLQFAYGRSLEKNGSTEEAMAVYQEALKKHPRRADVLDRLAVLHDKKGQFEQAMPLHKKAIAREPGNADFLCNLGFCYYLQQRWPEAEAQFRKAIEVAPEHRRALNNLGLVLAHTNRSREALAAFQRGGCSEADAHSNLAFALTLENSWKEAQAHYAHAHQLDPSSSPAAKGLQTVNARVQQPKKIEKTPAPPTIDNTPAVTLKLTEPAPILNSVIIENLPAPASNPQIIMQAVFIDPPPTPGIFGAAQFETAPLDPSPPIPKNR